MKHGFFFFYTSCFTSTQLWCDVMVFPCGKESARPGLPPPPASGWPALLCKSGRAAALQNFSI